MKRMLVVAVIFLLTGAYVGGPVKGADTPKEQDYIAVFYCLNAQSVVDQRQAGKHQINVGSFLPSIDPDSYEMRKCAKGGGVLMGGYVEVTRPFATLDEGKDH